MPATELTIVIKGITDNGVTPPGLERLFSAGNTETSFRPTASDELLFHLFGLEITPGQDLPVAAVTRLLDLGVVDKGWWLRADPVYLVPGRKGLIMAANRQLKISEQECADLAAEISVGLLEEGWSLKTPNPHRWYLKPPSPAAITTTPIDAVMGKDIEGFLPQGKEAKAWHTRLNEIQILLHTSPANAAREAQGHLPINSVWIWGGGTLPQLKASDWRHVWSDDVVCQALARLSDTDSGKLPANYREWEASGITGKQLLVFNRQEQSDWSASFDGDWAVPLVDAIKRKHVGKLTLHIGVADAVTVTPDNLKPRWGWPFGLGRG